MRALVYVLFVAAGALALAAPALAAPDRVDAATLTAQEIRVLQQRLIDGKCFEGPADGKVSEALKTAVAQCPDQRPRLRVETGFHTANIWRIGVDAKCRLAATASEDKSLRLWSLPDGRPLRVLRPPIGDGNGGKVFATAVSPDGRFVASGGWDASYEVSGADAVTIFDAASGNIVARIGELPDPVYRLAFSRDGRWLAATLHGGAGVRVIDTANWRIVAEDKDYGGQSYGAAFGPDNRLYTTAYDGRIRRYAPPPRFAKEAEVATHNGKEPYGIAVDPEGQRIAVGIMDHPGVEIYDATTLKFRASADVKTIDNGDLFSVAWRDGGRVVVAGSKYWRDGKFPVVSFDRGGQLQQQQLPALATNTIMDLQPCGEGLAVASAGPAFGLYDKAGAAALWKSHVKADLRYSQRENFTISPDARRMRFGLQEYGAQPALFDLTKFTLRDNAEAEKDFLLPNITALPIENWEDNYKPKLGAKPIELDNFETSRSLAILPEGAGFVLGTEWSLRSYNAKGEQLWRQAVPSIVWGVNVSAGGRVIVAANGDGTIRWHRASDGQELLALFVNRETKEWVAWTPSGYYTASLNGENLIGWQVNRGWDQAADFFPASKFRDIYARPDIVAKVLDTLDEGKAIKEANAARTILPAPASISERLPPVLSILSPKDGETTSNGEVTINYLLRSPSNLPVDAVEVVVGGQFAVKRDANPLDPPVKKCLEDTKGLGATTGARQGCEGRLTLSLPFGESEVSIYARAGDVYSEFAKLRLNNRDQLSGKIATKPKLYVLAVGVSHYEDHSYNLQLADKDALDFALAFRRQKGGALYDDVEQRAVPDGDVKAVREGFAWLTKNVTDKDVAIIFFAGHGAVDENQNFYFLAHDSKMGNLRETAISGGEIIDMLKKLKGSPVLFLDACHSAASAGQSTSQFSPFNTANVANGFTAVVPRAVIFASSEGNESSQEDQDWGNGAFTKAVLEALIPQQGQRAGADIYGEGKITVAELETYIEHAVPKRTKDQQHPKMQNVMGSIKFLAEAR